MNMTLREARIGKWIIRNKCRCALRCRGLGLTVLLSTIGFSPLLIGVLIERPDLSFPCVNPPAFQSPSNQGSHCERDVHANIKFQ
jgi:hypothetical protein